MRYTVLFFLCLATVIAYIQRSAFNGSSRIIESSLGIGSSDMGAVMMAWYLAYAACQLPSGYLADQLGSKRALIVLILLWSCFTGMVGLSAGLAGLLLIWTLMGAAQAGIFPCCTKAIGVVFPRTQQAIASGLLASCMSLGAALAPLVTSRLLHVLQWQSVFALYAIPGVAWALFFAWLVRRPDAPPGPENDVAEKVQPPSDNHEASRPGESWVKLITDPQMLILCVQQFLRAGPMALFFTWYARVLQEAHDLSDVEAGLLASWPPLVGAFAGAIGGLLSDWLLYRTNNARLARQGMTFTLLSAGSIAALFAYFETDPYVSVGLMSVAAFSGMAGGVSGYSIAISYGGRRVATVFAAMNMSGNIGAALYPWVVGKIADRTHQWNYSILVFAGMFAAGAVCWAVLNPRGTLFNEDRTTP